MNEWWEDRNNLALMVGWMAREGCDPSELERAVEKPWAYTDEFASAAYNAQES